VLCAPTQVAQLFKSHSDLLEEFTYFLPDSTPPSQQVRQLALLQHAKAVQAHSRQV
jgi:histone deacetylase complex regulatory component SIN3